MRLVLFDVDGTLIDSRPAIVAAYRHAFVTVVGLDYPRTEEEITAVFEPRLAEVCFRIGGSRGEECVSAYSSFYLEHCDGLVRPFVGALELLKELNKRGFAVGLVTTKGRERIRPDLRRAGLASVPFAAIVCAEDTVERKPHPAPLLLAMELAGAGPEESAYVGDGPHDMLAAVAAGVLAVGAGYGYYGPDRLAAAKPAAVLGEPADLFAVLERHADGLASLGEGRVA